MTSTCGSRATNCAGDRVHLPWQEGAPRCVHQRRGEGINQ